MAIGFTTSAAYGSRQVIPDKGLSRQTTPRVLVASFGDGYEQRIPNGINNLNEVFSISFNTRTKEEIDDIMGYLASLQGSSSFNFVVPDSNNGGETTIKVVCASFSQVYAFDDYYSGTASFRRVYEP